MTEFPVRAAIALGSNLGDRRAHLERALVELAAVAGIRVLARSSFHDTAPESGIAGEPRYLNGAALLETTLAPRALLDALLAIEAGHGRERVRGRRNRPRTLDLDLLSYGTESIEEPGLVVPHPRMLERVFVLAPLAEIAGELRPAAGRPSVAELLAALEARRSEARASERERGPR